MKVNEIMVEGLGDTAIKALANSAKTLVDKIKKLDGISGFFRIAEKHSKELLEMFKKAKDSTELTNNLKTFAKKLSKSEQVSEAMLTEGFAKLALAGLVTLAGAASVVMAKIIGIYHQMGEPDILQGSHANLAGGILFGILPALMCATMAIFLIIEAKSNR